MAHMIECNIKIRGDLGSVWLVIEIFDFQFGQVVGIGGVRCELDLLEFGSDDLK